MSANQSLDGSAAADLHTRLVNTVVAQILDEPIAAGGSMSDVMILMESVLVGVLISIFPSDRSEEALATIASRVTDRLRDAGGVKTGRNEEARARRPYN